MNESDILEWLLEGDVSIQYQVHRDLLDSDQEHLREQIAQSGWGARFLSFRNQDGHWGQKFYQPKWISTHYTLLDLKNLGISPNIQEIKQTIAQVIQNHKGPDGGILPIGTLQVCDVCVVGMFLNYASYFRTREDDLKSIIDFLIKEHMSDGGFNCLSNTSGAVHSSMHTTISVLEGICEYIKNGYSYRIKELQAAESVAREFLLQHRLFKSDKTGKIIDKRFIMLSYPSRWRYDNLRALDYFRYAGVHYDTRMDDAVQVLIEKRRSDNRWPLQAKHPGQTHFDMEKAGGPSRWNTLRILRVFKHFNITQHGK